MDNYVGLSSMKSAYVDELASNGELDKASSVQNTEVTDPIFSGYSVHPEQEPDVTSINETFRDIAVDIYALNQELKAAAANYNALMANMKLHLESADELLQTEEDRIKDMNIICGNYQEFATVKTLKTSDVSGTFGSDGERVFTCATSGSPTAVDLTVIQIAGNGYEGNAYVKNGDDTFLADTLDSSTRDNLVDNSGATYYEYSRLTSTGEDEYPADVNFDTEEAMCSIALVSEDKFSAIKIDSSQDNLVVKDVLTSDNGGASFTSCMSCGDLAINNRDATYEDSEYIFNSGILAIPTTNYVRVVLQSGGTTSESLAYRKVDTTDANNPSSTVVDLPNTKRHAIKINDISAQSASYITNSKFRTGELISAPVSSIAIFASEYIPPYYTASDDYIQYVLTVNGVDYDVVPINGYKKGTKIIRCTQHNVLDNYVVKLNESIKSAYLTIIMKTLEAGSTPYLSNLKVCLGKAVTKE